MRHGSKHHHRQKDKNHHKAANLDHADSQLFTSAENHSYIMFQTAIEALLTLLLNICDNSQLAATILPGKPWSSFTRENTSYQFGLQEEEQCWQFSFSRAPQLPAPIPALYSSSEVWKRVKKQGDLEAQPLPLQLSASSLSEQPCCNSPAPFFSSFSSGVAFGIPQGKSTNGQIISGEAQH